ncbi:MAG: signal peptidase II [Candidatus Neomarinimicrobiota bacterium]|jgi:signal peptidase II|nr:signal peptidase II [Candidatus Neomarinimicrobiota bacterium]MEE3138975.1 signal peptidase II [Candidatus Neomarinimicrobiota bacterium]|tara:strand:- start:1899 stop:2348 length:450 start_codon:yes stop_codon:yes gene_type:complete
MNFFLICFIVLIDQISKILIHAKINLYESIQIIPHLLDFTYIRNEGIAFGINFAGSKVIFIVFPILITFYLFSLLKDKEFDKPFYQISLLLIIGGAIGNIIDRIFRGYVIDFIDFHINNVHWYVFNLADSSVTIGLLFLLYSSIIIQRQ